MISVYGRSDFVGGFLNLNICEIEIQGCDNQLTLSTALDLVHRNSFPKLNI